MDLDKKVVFSSHTCFVGLDWSTRGPILMINSKSQWKELFLENISKIFDTQDLQLQQVIFSLVQVIISDRNF